MHKILIAAHTFPPAPGIGGRRWAKFAACLAASGYSVHVLSAAQRYSKEQRSIWSDDVANIPLVTWKHRFPQVLQSKPRGLWSKLEYRAALLANRALCKGTPYDRAQYDQRAFCHVLRDALTEQRPDVVVVTAPPFRLLYYASQLIPAHPKALWCADFRDPWTAGISYGYASLTKQRREWELRAEAATVEKFHIITSPWESVVAYMREKYPQAAYKILHLPHTWDPRDVGHPVSAFPEGLPYLIYGGNVYPEFNEVVAGLGQLAKAGEARVSIFSEGVCPLAAPHPVGFEWNAPVAPVRFFTEAKKASWLIFLIPENARNGMPSKIYEYAATGVPLLAIGHRGSLQEMIEREGLGIYVSHQQDLEGLRLAISRMTLTSNGPKWAAPYALESVTRQWLGILHNAENINA